MKITNEQKQNFGASLFFLGVAISIFSLGQMVGHLRGYRKAFEDAKEWDCKAKYSLTPQNEIVGDCLKYFVVQ